MILYILRFSASILAFYVFYKMVLQNETSYNFNRTFLLIGIPISLLTPLISLGSKPEINAFLSEVEPLVSTHQYALEQWFGIAYLFVFVLLSIRFIVQILVFVKKIRKYKTQKHKGATLVLTNDKTTPYIFLNYIFINKKTVSDLPAELLNHELTHVNQNHTLDILFIEIIKTIFWFNPLLFYYKKAMQLNHEFLADQNVLNSETDLKFYQNLLLQNLSDKSYNLSSSLNFSLTKKRFIMMNKRPSGTPLFKKILVLPVFAFVFFACSNNEGVSGNEMLYYWRHTAKLHEILSTGSMSDKDIEAGIIVRLETKAQIDKLNNIYDEMSSKQKKSVFRLPVPVSNRVRAN